MKKIYLTPKFDIEYASMSYIICTSSYGPNSEIIPVGGEGGDEEVAPPPSHSLGFWDE